MVNSSKENRIKSEVERIKIIGERIGYSHLLQLASALYFKNQKEKGLDISEVLIPVDESSIKESKLELIKKKKNLYDNFLDY